MQQKSLFFFYHNVDLYIYLNKNSKRIIIIKINSPWKIEDHHETSLNRGFTILVNT